MNFSPTYTLTYRHLAQIRMQSACLFELLPVCVLHIPLSVKCEHQSDPWYAIVYVCACMRPPDVRDTRELPKHLGGTQAVNVDKLRNDECPDVCGKFWACLADCCWKNWTIVRHVKTNARFSARAPMRVPCRACVASGWSGPAQWRAWTTHPQWIRPRLRCPRAFRCNGSCASS